MSCSRGAGADCRRASRKTRADRRSPKAPADLSKLRLGASGHVVPALSAGRENRQGHRPTLRHSHSQSRDLRSARQDSPLPGRRPPASPANCLPPPASGTDPMASASPLLSTTGGHVRGTAGTRTTGSVCRHQSSCEGESRGVRCQCRRHMGAKGGVPNGCILEPSHSKSFVKVVSGPSPSRAHGSCL